jgi:hypothetical protein
VCECEWRKDPFFSTYQGLRQGCPLSPLMFNLLAAALSTLLRKAANQGKIRGVMTHLLPEGITHIQYADDTIIMIEGDDASVINIEKPSGQFLGLARFEFKSGTILFCFSFIFVSFRESCLLVSWCAGGRCGMTNSNKDHGRSSRPGAEDRGWSHRSGTRWSGDREVGWRRVWFAPCMWRRGAWVSWLSLKTKVNGL